MRSLQISRKPLYVAAKLPPFDETVVEEGQTLFTGNKYPQYDEPNLVYLDYQVTQNEAEVRAYGAGATTLIKVVWTPQELPPDVTIAAHDVAWIGVVPSDNTIDKATDPMNFTHRVTGVIGTGNQFTAFLKARE